MNETQIARFRAKINSNVEGNECHEWIGAKGPAGYGTVSVAGHRRSAHRVAWEIENGPIPTGLIVRHDCDNPPCCNVRHLRLGTIADNNQDAKERRRHWQGGHHAVAKLTDADVLRARQMRLDGMAWKAIAASLGVSYTAAHYAVTGETWRHLPKIDLPKFRAAEHIADDIIETARRMRDEEGQTWADIEAATGYTRRLLQRHLPARTGYNPNPPKLNPEEAIEAVQLRRAGLSWTKLAAHFGNKISRMTLYQAWVKQFAWWHEAEQTLGEWEALPPAERKKRDPRWTHNPDVYETRRGTNHWNAKLDPAKVELIRTLRLGGWSWYQIAEHVGVSRHTAKYAGSGDGWKHLGPAPEVPAMVKGRRGRNVRT